MILQKLYYGEIKPWEKERQYSLARRIDEKKLEDTVSNLQKILPVQENKQFADLLELLQKSANEDEVAAFSKGFILGMNIAMESIKKT